MLTYPPTALWPDKTEAMPEPASLETFNVCRELLDANIARGRGNSAAIHFSGVTINYEQLLDDVTRMAGSLRDCGVKQGDGVLLRLFNRPHFIVAFLAILRLGAVAVPTPPLLRSREIRAILEACQPVAVVFEQELWSELEKLDGSQPPFIDVAELTDGSPIVDCAPVARDAPAVVLFTSGSTGVPKGCMHSHADLLAVCDSYARHVLSPAPTDRFGGHPTMAFAYGLGGLLLFPLRFGASTVLLDRFTPEAMIDSIQSNKVTIAFCAPISLRRMMLEPRKLHQTLRSLRLVVSAGETLPAKVYRAWREATSVEVLDGIGTTEMLHIFISSRPGRSRAGSTGEVVPGYEAAVIDEKTMERVPDGQAGLLAVKGPTGCRYLHLPEAQQNYVRDGWNIPGDLYIRDEEGFFYYQCRNDDLIICGGINIAAPEVENVLLEHPAVLEAAVIASADEMHGMIPKAFVVLRGGHEPSDDLKRDLQAFVRGELAPYKYPRSIAFVGALPKTSTGKIRKAELRRGEIDR